LIGGGGVFDFPKRVVKFRALCTIVYGAIFGGSKVSVAAMEVEGEEE
jgi:hypothetical protein